MPKPHGPGHGARVRRSVERPERRARRFAALAVVGVVFTITLLLTAFGAGASRIAVTPPAPAQRLLPTGPPAPLVLATQGSLRIQLPIARSRVTAIGYHAADDGALALDPLGTQGNAGLLARLARRILGQHSSGLVYYQLDGGSGPSTGALDVGAATGTDVYSPVDGTIVGLTDFVIDNHVYGQQIDVQPASAPSLVVSLTHLQPDPSLAVGSPVTETSKLGTLVDLSRVERQALARYTQDTGNHVSIEVHPAATLALP